MKGEIRKAAKAARTVVAYPRELRPGSRPGFELSFDASLGKPGEDPDFSLHDTISEDDDAGDALKQEIASEAEVLALGALTDRERRIYEARHLDENQLALQQLGDELGISAERVRQIETIAERKVAAAMDIPRTEREWFQPKPASQNGRDHRTPERRQRALEDRGFSPELGCIPRQAAQGGGIVRDEPGGRYQQARCSMRSNKIIGFCSAARRSEMPTD